MANKPGEANFFPDVPVYPEMGTFQPVYGKFDLTTYIQGASDYEIMAFLVGKYNACLEAYGTVTKLSTETVQAAHQLQDWINTWFTNLDVQQELNNKIDSMVQDGSFETLLHQTFDAQINQQTTSAVTAWLVANVTPTGSAVVVDKSLSIEGAAADAKATGEIKKTTDEINKSLVDIDSALSIPLNTSNFVGYGCNVSVNNDKLAIGYSGESLDIWVCGATEKKGKKIIFNDVEFYAIGTVVINSATWILAICNNSSNFGCLYVFHAGGFSSAKITDKVINGDYSAHSNLAIEILGTTEIKVDYNGTITDINVSNYSYKGRPFDKAIIGYMGYITRKVKTYEKAFNNEPNYLTKENARMQLSNWKNKVGYALGDSITYYNYYEPLVKSDLGLADYINGGHSAYTIGDLRDIVILDMKGNNYDFITVFAGTNDFGKNKEIGTNDSTGTGTVKGGTNALIDELLADFPTTPIMFILPLQRDYFGTATSEIRGMTNSLGLTLREYVDAIKEICELRGFPVLDMYSIGGMKPQNVHSWTIDGLHPNKTYWEKHYKLISDFINAQYPTN